MTNLTIPLPNELDEALREASARRRMSRAELVRETLEEALSVQGVRAESVSQWLSRWRGVLRRGAIHDDGDDARMAHLLNKHLH